jgi:histidinol-phosphate phosphatase family protein
MSKAIPPIDKNWTLFLDRDGVINKKLDNDYVKTINEFEFLPNVLEALKVFSKHFHKIVIVTNQQGISKKLMSDYDLEKVHQYLLKEVTAFGGTIDAIYHAPQLASENSIMRKPNIGMAITAKNDFPSIDFNKCIMIGDSISDMEFAQNTNMFEVFIGENEDYFCIDSLYSFCKLLKN